MKHFLEWLRSQRQQIKVAAARQVPEVGASASSDADEDSKGDKTEQDSKEGAKEDAAAKSAADADAKGKTSDSPANDVERQALIKARVKSQSQALHSFIKDRARMLLKLNPAIASFEVTMLKSVSTEATAGFTAATAAADAAAGDGDASGDAAGGVDGDAAATDSMPPPPVRLARSTSTSSVADPPSGNDDGKPHGQSQLASMWRHVLPPASMQPLLQRWTSNPNGEDSSAWGVGGGRDGMASLIPAMRTVRGLVCCGAASHAAMCHSPRHALCLRVAQPVGGDKVSACVAASQSVVDFCTTMNAASAKVVATALKVRDERARSREHGLKAFHELVAGTANVPCVLRAELVHLRPAFKSQLVDPHGHMPVHYFQHLAGCSTYMLDRVQGAMIEVFTLLSDVTEKAHALGDPALTHMALWNFMLDYETRDHEMLMRVGLVPLLCRTISSETCVPCSPLAVCVLVT